MANSTVTTTSNSVAPTPEETLASVQTPTDTVQLSTAPQGDFGYTREDQPPLHLQTAGELSPWWQYAPDVLREMRSDPKPPSSAVPMRVEESWNGVVTRVDNDAFEASFVAQEGGSPRLQAEFSTGLIDPDDLELLLPGALFELTVGRARVYETRWMPTMRIRIRRLPVLTEADVDDALEAARAIRQSLLSHEP